MGELLAEQPSTMAALVPPDEAMFFAIYVLLQVLHMIQRSFMFTRVLQEYNKYFATTA